ncbi:MAG: capsular biosynthesis protein CpsI, partial [Xanthomonadaceae bacterium]|nr:capsular biosynthesis protein CpsI [Xanthomonadaceae bacterium]
DIVEGVIRTLDRVPAPDRAYDPLRPNSATSSAPYRVYNIGNSHPVQLSHYIEVLEDCLGRQAEQNLLPLQPGDVPDTSAEVTELMNDTGYKPDTSVEEGVKRFVEWYRNYYGV